MFTMILIIIPFKKQGICELNLFGIINFDPIPAFGTGFFNKSSPLKRGIQGDFK